MQSLQLFHIMFNSNNLKQYESFNLISTNYFPKFMSFSTLVQFKEFEVIWKHQLKHYKSSLNSKGNESFGHLSIYSLPIVQLFSSSTSYPLYFGGAITFLSLIYFLRFLMLWMCQEKGFKHNDKRMDKISLNL